MCYGGKDLARAFRTVRQLLGPFPDMRLMVSGGVNASNVAEYASLGVTGICLGSAYLGALLTGKGKKVLVKEMQQFVKLVARAQATKNTIRKRGK